MRWPESAGGCDADVGPTRARLLGHVEAHPGACIQDLADALGITRTAALHHVRRLLRSGHLTAVRRGRRVHHFPSALRDGDQQTMLGLLRLQNTLAVARALADDPTRSWRRLARELNLSAHTVRWHVARLREQGLLRTISNGLGIPNRVVLHPALLEQLGAASSDGVDAPMPHAVAPTVAPATAAALPAGLLRAAT